MTGFVKLVSAEHISDERWKLLSDLTYVSMSTEEITVASGFVTDFASIPKFLLSIFGRPSGITAEPSVLHDWLYSGTVDYGFSRKDCDDIFLEALEVRDVNWFKRHTMYKGVRMFGSKHYKNS